MRGVGFVACVLAGCNAAFGLEPTIAIDGGGPDFDHDGVADSVDNCPQIANPDQATTDDDAFGDACDNCPSVAAATTHDEDQDGVGDACDLCPGVADFANDSDGDGVGDICDPKPLVIGNVRAAFETFVTLPPEWQAPGIGWVEADDAIAPSASLPANDSGLGDTILTVSPPWSVSIGYTSSSPWGTSEIAAIGVKLGVGFVRCRVDCPTPACEAIVDKNGAVDASITPIVPRPFSRMTLAVDAAGNLTCKLDETRVSGPFTFAATGPATFSVIASPDVQITFFEVIQ